LDWQKQPIIKTSPLLDSIPAMKPKSQITAYIIWQTKIFLNLKIAISSGKPKYF
jgi:hypothetical protein